MKITIENNAGEVLDVFETDTDSEEIHGKIVDTILDIAADLESKPAFIDYGTINFTPANAPVRKAVRKCDKASHARREETIGNCWNRYTCDVCGFCFDVDSSD